MDPINITVGFKGANHSVQLAPSATLGDLATELAQQCSVDPQTIKLLAPGRAGMIKTAEEPQRAIREAGIKPGARLKMMASAAADVAAVRDAKDLPGLAPLDHELRREIARRTPPASPPSGRVREANPYSFGCLQTWDYPRLNPPPSEAFKLLQRISSDPGIVGVMAKHRWRVGLLSEMPPEGYVGVDPVCILGFNRNRGQEISLRLRTDDLKGFRRYDRILETMLHELAHMVHDEHDSHFKELNSQLRREAAQMSWHSAPAARTAAGAVFDGVVEYDLPPAQQDAMAATAAFSGRSLKELADGPGGNESSALPAKAAAAQAALQRALQATAAAGRESGSAGQSGSGRHASVSGSGSPPEVQRAAYPAGGYSDQQVGQERQSESQPHFQQYRKGDLVWYRERDGRWLATEVVHVEHGVHPPSYGISMPSQAGASGSGDPGGPGFRETEGSRLRPRNGGEATQPGLIGAPGGPGDVQGLGPFDSNTAAKEEAVHRLLEG